MAAQDDRPDGAEDAPADPSSEAGESPPAPAPAASPVAPVAPPPPPGPPRSHRMWLVGVLTAVLLALDLWTKQWAWDHLREGATEVVVKGWVYLQFGFNTGSAFSMLEGVSWSRMLFIGITFLALAYMGFLARTLPTRFTSPYVAIALVASGALGNLHDRFVRTLMIDGVERHGVVDFIKVYYWKGKPWPTFNVADVTLVAGVVLLMLFLMRHGEVLDAEANAKKAAANRA